MSTTVLLVDDHQMMRDGLRAVIEKEPELKVVGEADNGRAAVELARNLSPDVVVMDIAMPDMNGIDLAGRLRNRDIAAPVILITGYPDENISARAEAAGVRHVLMKPLLDESLVTRIRGAIRDAGPVEG